MTVTVDLFLDPGTGDLNVSDSGVIRLTSGTLESVAQRLRIKLRTFLGEWFLDTNVGVPYYQSILGVKNPDLGPIASISRTVLLADEDVESVPKMQLTLNGRTLEVVTDIYAIDRDPTSGTSGAAVLVSVSTQSDPLIVFF